MKISGIPADLALHSLTLTGDLTVGGGATVVGEMTSESVYETLNSDKTSGAPTEDMGFRARRGASPWWVVGWDETNDRTIIGTSTDGTVANTTGGAVVVGSLLAGNGSAAAPSYSFATATSTGLYLASATMIYSQGGTAALRFGDGITMRSSGAIAWSSGAILAAEDLFLLRDAANVLAQRNSTNAQTFRVYNTYTDASNYERATFQYSGNVLQITHQAAGSGLATRQIQLFAGVGGVLSLGTNGGVQWRIDATGNLIGITDNLVDIGASGATRPRSVYAATSVGATGSRVPAIYLGGNTPAASAPFLDATQTWNDAGVTFIGVKWVFTNTASAATSFPFQIYGGAAGTTPLLTVMINGDVTSGGWLRAGTNVACAAASYLVVTNRLTIGASADGVATLQNYAANDFTRLCFGGITSAFGALGRDGAGIKLIGGDGTTGIFLSGIEQTAPAAPAANGYRIYAEDNGAGKTRLMCLFGSGAAQQLAIEP